MKLCDRPEIFKRLVRATSLDEAAAELPLVARWCPDHGLCLHYGVGVCELCVLRSRVLSEIGRQGGRIGGKADTPKKRKAFAKVAAKRWTKKVD